MDATTIDTIIGEHSERSSPKPCEIHKWPKAAIEKHLDDIKRSLYEGRAKSVAEYADEGFDDDAVAVIESAMHQRDDLQMKCLKLEIELSRMRHNAKRE